MGKKLLLIIIIIILAGILMGSHLVRRSSHDIDVTRLSRTIFWDSATQTATEIVCNVPTHLKALHDGETQGIIFDSTLGLDEVFDVLFYAPTSQYAHILWDAESKLTAEFDVYLPSADDVTNGAQLTPKNFKIGDPIDTTATVYIAAAVDTTGDKMPVGGFIGAGKNTGGNYEFAEEMLANGGTVVLFRVKSDDNNNDTRLKIWWHVTDEGVIP